MDEPVASGERDLDVVLVGATGFVGRLTAAELARTAPPTLRVALAGRDVTRVERVRAELGAAAIPWHVVAVDVTDDAAVQQLVERTRVVVTTVGPYYRFGRRLVDACARSGTHYADLTGEVLFVRESIDANHDIAASSGARIVHACGFDSIPSDLGVLLTAEAAHAAGDGALRRATLHVRRLRGGVSGGTVDSAREQLAVITADRERRRIVLDPFALSPDRDGEPDRMPAAEATDGVTGEPAPGGSRLPSLRRLPARAARALPIGRDGDTDRWHAPFVMAGFNTRIVRRSNALSGWSYGRQMRYSEVLDTGRGVTGGLRAAALTAAMGTAVAGMVLPPTRRLLDRVLPGPGDGPTESTMRTGLFDVAIEAVATSGRRYRTIVAADRDPGYGATAVMLAQSALCLALDPPAGRGHHRAGVLTPATAMGAPLADRLRAQGFTLKTRPLD